MTSLIYFLFLLLDLSQLIYLRFDNFHNTPLYQFTFLYDLVEIDYVLFAFLLKSVH